MADRRLGPVAARLGTAGCIAPEEEAGALLSAGPDDATLEAWLRRREQGEPLAWILPTVRFGGVALHVEPGVYVPRPQSEDLARRAVALLPAGGRLLDLCTGSGAIAAVVASLTPTASVAGVDVSDLAARCALSNGVPAVQADLAAVPVRPASIDVVVSVAPYVPTQALEYLPADVRRHEPRLALDGGADGLRLVRSVVRTASVVLRPGGWLILELGGDQASLLAPDLRAAGFARTTTWVDEHDDLRGLVARRG